MGFLYLKVAMHQQAFARQNTGSHAHVMAGVTDCSRDRSFWLKKEIANTSNKNQDLMGTGGLVVFRSLRGKKKQIYLKAQFHCDGDHSSLGHKLAKFLSGVRFTNGLSDLDGLESAVLNPDLIHLWPKETVEQVQEHRKRKEEAGETVCNGFDCMVAQFIAKFKHGPGNLYVLPVVPEEELLCDFVYVVDCELDHGLTSDSLRVTTWQGREDPTAEAMNLQQFSGLCDFGQGLQKKARGRAA